MQVIWKIALERALIQDILIPHRSQILHVGLQRGEPHLWYSCDPDWLPAPRRIHVVFTGDPNPVINTGHYLGTVQVGDLVLHYYERGL